MLGQHQVQAARGRSNLPGAKLIGGGEESPPPAVSRLWEY